MYRDVYPYDFDVTAFSYGEINYKVVEYLMEKKLLQPKHLETVIKFMHINNYIPDGVTSPDDVLLNNNNNND